MTAIEIRARLEELETKRILAIYNEVTGKSITKFSTRTAGLRQTTAALVQADDPKLTARLLKGSAKRVSEDERLAADYGCVNCPSCGVHLSNGVSSDRQGHFECMACGHEWGTMKSEKRAKSVADSWKDPEVAAKRAQRSRVRANGVEYRSVREAFVALNLPLAKHIRFRMALKAAGKAEFDGVKFEVVS